MADYSRFPILSHLQGIEWKANDPNVGECFCPVHGDGEKSGKRSLHLEIKPASDGLPMVVMHCHAGCKAPEIVAKLGFPMSSLFTPRDYDGPSGNGGGHGGGPSKPRTSGKGGSPAAAKPEASSTEKKKGTWDRAYPYFAADGKIAHQTVRYKDPKSFYQRRPANPDEVFTLGKKTWKARKDPSGRWWLNTLNGIEPVVYNLPQILANPQKAIYFVEGEKDADTLISLGFTATTVPMGSGKWRKSYAEAFRGRVVVLIPDMDKIRIGQTDRMANCGVDGAKNIACELMGIAKQVRILYLPDFDGELTPKWDVTDWIHAHPDGPKAAKAELEGRARATEILTPDHPGLQPAGKKSADGNQTPDVRDDDPDDSGEPDEPGTDEPDEPTEPTEPPKLEEDVYGFDIDEIEERPEGPNPSPPKAPAKPATDNIVSNFRDMGNDTYEALPMEEILETINRTTGGWPKRVGGSLFFCDRESDPTAKQFKVDWLDRPASVFGWMSTRLKKPIHFHRGIPYAPTKEETFAELQRNVEMYTIIERFPHYPSVPTVYYACPENSEFKNKKVGCLESLVDMFLPATKEDRSLIMALILTMFWGGPGGRRPLFVIASDAGRGAGKTALAELLSSLVGGALQLSANADDEILRQRLLSPEGMEKRVVTLDNIKSDRFSWAEFEALITSEMISGKRMYVGEGSRMNLIVYLLTMNGPAFSTDLAQRSVVIKLKKADYQLKDWHAIVGEFIKKNLESLIAEILARLAGPKDVIVQNTRWSQWENEVLSATDHPNKALDKIVSRQSSLDCEQDEAISIQSYFEQQLERNGTQYKSMRIFITSKTAGEWLALALNQKMSTIGAGRKLTQLINEGRLPRLTKSEGPETVGTTGRRDRGFWMTPIGWDPKVGDNVSPNKLNTYDVNESEFRGGLAFDSDYDR